MTKSLFTRLAAGVAAAALAATLAGCGGGSKAPSGTMTPVTPTTSVTRMPETPTTPPPTSSEPPVADDLSTWIVTPDALGPVALGDDFAATLKELPGWTNDEQCSWTAFWNTPEGTMNVYFARDSAADAGPVITVAVDRLEAVQPEDGPHTESGVGLGSTRADVMAAYPDAAEQTSTIGGRQMLRVGEQGTAAMFFTLDADDTVSGISVTTAEEPPYEVCG